MKVLFLDVDGVLNSGTWFDSHTAKTTGAGWLGLSSVDPAAVKRLLHVINATGAKVVLSSTWRLVPDQVSALRGAGIEIADMTPRIDTRHRGEEIHAWLVAHPEVTTFAILDDDEDAGDGFGLASHFVKTEWQDGLRDEHCEKLIALLGLATEEAAA